MKYTYDPYKISEQKLSEDKFCLAVQSGISGCAGFRSSSRGVLCLIFVQNAINAWCLKYNGSCLPITVSNKKFNNLEDKMCSGLAMNTSVNVLIWLFFSKSFSEFICVQIYHRVLISIFHYSWNRYKQVTLQNHRTYIPLLLLLVFTIAISRNNLSDKEE